MRWVPLEGGGARIGIDRVREIQKDARFQPLESQYKAYVLPEAERLTPEAANSLLKILEDPPEYVLFLLLARGLRLLPTILSRCQIVRIRPFSTRQLAEVLARQGYSEDEIRYGLALAQGIPSRNVRLLLTPSWLGEKPLQRREALLSEIPKLCPTELAERFSQTEDPVEEHETARALLLQLTGGERKPHEVLELASTLARIPPEKAELFLWESLRWMRDLLLSAQNAENRVFHRDRLQDVRAISPRWSTESLVRAIHRLERGLSALQANANAQLLWESLLFQLGFPGARNSRRL